MFPAFLIRAGIDWVRHHQQFQDSNPYSRCQESLKVCQRLWQEQIGPPDLSLLEPATITAYWSEFFHAEERTADEQEWREGLLKCSGQYDSFDSWQQWFKQNYAQVYQEDNIWKGVLTTSWAHTHQYEIVYRQDSWEFCPATPYLPTSQMWRLKPYMTMVAQILHKLWDKEIKEYNRMGFSVDELQVPHLGKVEGLGFDTHQQVLSWPPRAQRQKEILELGDLIADIVVPTGDNWYRQLDNVIFADSCVDVTALINRAQYVLGSRRRLLELSVDNGYEQARIQALAEGWLVSELQGAAS